VKRPDEKSAGCEGYPWEECFSQHRLLVTVLKWQNETVTQKKTGGRVKLWRLKDEKTRKSR